MNYYRGWRGTCLSRLINTRPKDAFQRKGDRRGAEDATARSTEQGKFAGHATLTDQGKKHVER